MDAVIYARVSTDGQRENYSIPTQIDECLKFCRKQEYNIVGDRFVDQDTGLDQSQGEDKIPAFVDNYTSREISRPGINAMFSFLDRVGFDVVVVYAIDRMARDPFIREYIERELRKQSVTVEYVSGNYDHSPEGEVRKDIEAVFAKWENAKRVERSNRGKRKKAESGQYVGGRSPYGYTIDREQLGGLAVVEEEAKVVRMIYDWYINEDESIRGITRRLNKMSIPTSMGNGKWYKSSVYKILKNTAYIGHVYYNKTKRVDGQRVERDPSEWIKIKISSIVDEQLFAQAQKELKHNKKIRRRRTDRFYLLSGRIYCDQCKHVYSGETQKAGKQRRKNDAQYYRHRKAHGHCKNRYISARILEPVVWEEVKKILLDPEHLRKGYEQATHLENQQYLADKEKLEKLHQELERLDRQNDQVIDVFTNPDLPMSREEYITQKETLKKRKEQLLQKVSVIRKELKSFTPPPTIESMEKFTEGIRKRLVSSVDFSKQEMREVLDSLDVNVWIGEGDTFRLTGRIQSPHDRLAFTSHS